MGKKLAADVVWNCFINNKGKIVFSSRFHWVFLTKPVFIKMIAVKNFIYYNQSRKSKLILVDVKDIGNAKSDLGMRVDFT